MTIIEEIDAKRMIVREEIARRLAYHAAGRDDLWAYLTPDGQQGWLAMADDALTIVTRRIRESANDARSHGFEDSACDLEHMASELEK